MDFPHPVSPMIYVSVHLVILSISRTMRQLTTVVSCLTISSKIIRRPW